MLQPSVKVVQCTRHFNANLESSFPREGIMVVSTAVEVVAEVSIDHELVDQDHLLIIETISDERDVVRVV